MSTSFWSALHMKKSHPAILPCHGTPSCLIFRRLCRAIHVFRRLCLQSQRPFQGNCPRFLGYDARAFLQNQMRRTSNVGRCHVEYEYQKKSPEQAKHIGTTSKTAWCFSSIFPFLLTLAGNFHPETQKNVRNFHRGPWVFRGQYDAKVEFMNHWTRQLSQSHSSTKTSENPTRKKLKNNSPETIEAHRNKKNCRCSISLPWISP